MKTTIIFYSFSGNTRRAALFLKEKQGLGEVEIIDLRPKEEEKSFFKQCFQAFSKKEPALKETAAIEGSDFLIFASPVWAFTIAPALRSYLKGISSLKGKRTACFVTYGSGTGSMKALNELENTLKEKGAQVLFSKGLSGFKTKNKIYLEEKFKNLVEVIKK